MVLRGRLSLVLLSSLLVLAGGLWGCAEPHLTHYEPVEEALQRGDYQTPVEVIRAAREDEEYEAKDRVLYWIEKGIALHYAGDYERSNELLTKADRRMDELYTTRISEEGYAFLTNPNQLEYEGDPHEDLYINVFKALNFLEMGDPDAARVEARKLNHKLNVMHDRYRERADEYRRVVHDKDYIDADDGDTPVDFDVDQTEFHESALARYIGYMTYLHDRSLDSVRIDWENMREAFVNQPDIYRYSFPDFPAQPRISNESVPVHFIAKLGFGPVKEPDELYLPWGDDEHIKVALPEMVSRGTDIDRVDVYNEDRLVTSLNPFEDVNRIAENVFELRYPSIVGTAFVRAIAKRVGAGELADQVASQDPLAGLVAEIAGEIFIEETEQPDLRLVRTLPGEFHVAMEKLSAGDYEFQLRYYSDGDLVEVETFEERVTPDKLNVLIGRSFQ